MSASETTRERLVQGFQEHQEVLRQLGGQVVLSRNAWLQGRARAIRASRCVVEAGRQGLLSGWPEREAHDLGVISQDGAELQSAHFWDASVLPWLVAQAPEQFESRGITASVVRRFADQLHHVDENGEQPYPAAMRRFWNAWAVACQVLGDLVRDARKPGEAPSAGGAAGGVDPVAEVGGADNGQQQPAAEGTPEAVLAAAREQAALQRQARSRAAAGMERLQQIHLAMADVAGCDADWASHSLGRTVQGEGFYGYWAELIAEWMRVLSAHGLAHRLDELSEGPPTKHYAACVLRAARDGQVQRATGLLQDLATAPPVFANAVRDWIRDGLGREILDWRSKLQVTEGVYWPVLVEGQPDPMQVVREACNIALHVTAQRAGEHPVSTATPATPDAFIEKIQHLVIRVARRVSRPAIRLRVGPDAAALQCAVDAALSWCAREERLPPDPMERMRGLLEEEKILLAIGRRGNPCDLDAQGVVDGLWAWMEELFPGANYPSRPTGCATAADLGAAFHSIDRFLRERADAQMPLHGATTSGTELQLAVEDPEVVTGTAAPPVPSPSPVAASWQGPLGLTIVPNPRKAIRGEAAVEFGGEDTLWNLFVLLTGRYPAYYLAIDLVRDALNPHQEDDDPAENAVHQHMTRLRALLGRIDLDPKHCRGQGYRLEVRSKSKAPTPTSSKGNRRKG